MPPASERVYLENWWLTAEAEQAARHAQLSFDRMVAATQMTGVSIASVRETIQENNENQGGTGMPETAEYATIRVPQGPGARRVVFDRLNLYETMMGSLDEQTWLEGLRQLTQSTGDVEWRVHMGSFDIEEYPASGTPDRPIIIETVAPDVAVAFVSAASNWKVELVPEDGFNEVAAYVLRPLAELDRLAWVRYTGGYRVGLYSEYQSENEYVSVLRLRDLREMMRTYHEYLTSGVRRTYVRQVLRERMRASNPVGTANSRTSVENDPTQMNKFQEFLDGVKSRLQPEDNPFQKLPILPHKTLSSRTWGIEIEAVDIAGVTTPKYWELKGDGSLRSLSPGNSLPSRSIDPTYTNPPLIPGDVDYVPNRTENPPPFVMEDHDEECPQFDGVDTYYNTCECGYWESQDEYESWADQNDGGETQTGEWNSPVLRSFHSRGLKYLTGELEPRRTNNTAGIHVHVNATDLTPEQAVRLTVIYTALEPLFEAEYKRGDTRRYCEPVNMSEIARRFGQMRAMKQGGGGVRNMQFSSRYWSVNLASLSSHGTIEFRSMGPIYNYEHLVRWAYLVRELVNIAKADVPQSAWTKVRTMEDLVTLFSRYGKETPTPEWAEVGAAEDQVEKIVSKLGSENRRNPHSQPLLPGSLLQLVNDDYSSSALAVSEPSPYQF